MAGTDARRLLSLPLKSMISMGSEAKIVSLFEQWRDHFNGRDWNMLAGLYAEDATLFATSKPNLFKGRDQIRSYFQSTDDVTFQGWDSSWLSPDTALVAGTYGFREELDGVLHEKSARFTFLAQQRQGDFVIVHHHSSILP